MWEQLSNPWRACIDEAWQAYCAGSLPIGAVITDAEDTIVTRGRNRIFENTANGTCLYGSRVAHAEMNALLALAPDVNTAGYRLYTTTEPCPMCVGAIRMCRIREVHYAARDAVAGGTALFTAIPFMESDKVVVQGLEGTALEMIMLAIQVVFVLQMGSYWGDLFEAKAPDCARGVRLGRALFASGELENLRNVCSAEIVVETLAQKLVNHQT